MPKACICKGIRAAKDDEEIDVKNTCPCLIVRNWASLDNIHKFLTDFPVKQCN
jgi:hypothetical protein